MFSEHGKMCSRNDMGNEAVGAVRYELDCPFFVGSSYFERCEGFHLATNFLSLESLHVAKVKFLLHVEPKGIILSEELTEANGVFGGDGPLCVDDFVQAHWISMLTSLGLI